VNDLTSQRDVTLAVSLGSSFLTLVFQLIDSKKLAKKRKYTNSGVIKVVVARIDRQFSFLEFIAGG
jgi:hypothetical protein